MTTDTPITCAPSVETPAMTDAQASALPRLSVGDRVRVIARLDIPNPHDLPIGYVGVVEEVFPNGDVDLGEWACRRDEIELAGDEPARAASAPTGDMVLAADASPRDPRIKVIADAMSAKRQDLIAQPLSFIWEALAEAALTAAPSPSASTMGVDIPAVHLALGHLYGIADAIEAAQPWKAGDIRQHANAITRALACLSSAGGEGVVEAHARLPVARIIDDNQPGATAIVAIVCDPPTLGVGTLLYSRPRDHAAELVEAYCAGQRDASPTPPKAETETASEREKLVEENRRLREALAEIADRHIPDQPAAAGGDELSWAQRQHGALRAIARAALAQEHAR